MNAPLPNRPGDTAGTGRGLRDLFFKARTTTRPGKISPRPHSTEARSAAVPLRRSQGFWLLAAALPTVTLHLRHLPVWLSALCMLLLAARGILLWRAARPTPTLLIVLLGVLAGIGVKLDFGHFFGKDPGVAMLAVLLCLKLLEAGTARDARVAILLAFFLQLGLFFYDQTLVIAAPALVAAWLAIAALLSLQVPDRPLRASLRTSTLLLAQGLPFMLMLFVLFPRVQGPLWGLPADADSAVSGLSDTMAPGSISDLSLSDEIAFRAEFATAPPPPELRYWRGPVLTRFDGLTWRTGGQTLAGTPFYAPSGQRLDYRLTLEAHNQRWLLALDFPGAGEAAQMRHTNEFQLLARMPLRSRARFTLSAYPFTRVGIDQDAAMLERALALPAGTNPRTRALAAELLADGATDRQLLERAIAHFRASDLVYTLQPPLVETDTVDGFLFDSRQGFCEHFASAFTFLMRAAGVPARVVTGYQGGEINPIDGTLVVRQSDAHAWTEIWLRDAGWVRVDPTALAAPRRIQGGLARALPQGEPLPFMARSDLSWLRDLRHRWEALSNTWNQWVLGYTPERQRELLARLGLSQPDWQQMTLLLTATATLLMALLLVWATWRKRDDDALDRAWRHFCRRLARHGLARAAWEGPIDYGTRLAGALPRHAGELTDITTTYARLRYGPEPEPAAIRTLVQRIRRLDLG